MHVAHQDWHGLKGKLTHCTHAAKRSRASSLHVSSCLASLAYTQRLTGWALGVWRRWQWRKGNFAFAHRWARARVTSPSAQMRLLFGKRKPPACTMGDWMRSVGYRLEVGGGERGKATEADFSMSHLAVCKPSVETRSSRLGLTCSHRNRSKGAGEYFSGVQPKNSWCVERPPRERLGYGFIMSICTTAHQQKNIVVITKQCIFVVCTCEAQFLQLIAEDMYLIYVQSCLDLDALSSWTCLDLGLCSLEYNTARAHKAPGAVQYSNTF